MADQLWFMTRIREEEENCQFHLYVHTHTRIVYVGIFNFFLFFLFVFIHLPVTVNSDDTCNFSLMSNKIPVFSVNVQAMGNALWVVQCGLWCGVSGSR